jgi:hypothetical protein
VSDSGRKPLSLVVSYNQPRFNATASWNPCGVTILGSATLPNKPTRIFISKNNTFYVSSDNSGTVRSWIEGNLTPTRSVSGGYGVFVAANDDVYLNNGAGNQIIRWAVNATTAQLVLSTGGFCNGLFIDLNKTLYCCVETTHQVFTKSLDDPTDTRRIVAGTGCDGGGPTMLKYPYGIFVHVNFTLYVADSSNNRIQRFGPGQLNGTTVAGSTAPGTINLWYPRGVTLDGDGYLFIVDSNNHRIVGSGPNGFRCVASCLGSSGGTSKDLSYPRSMSFDSSGNIWVADYLNRRIQKFVLTGDSCGR